MKKKILGFLAVAFFISLAADSTLMARGRHGGGGRGGGRVSRGAFVRAAPVRSFSAPVRRSVVSRGVVAPTRGWQAGRRGGWYGWGPGYGFAAVTACALTSAELAYLSANEQAAWNQYQAQYQAELAEQQRLQEELADLRSSGQASSSQFDNDDDDDVADDLEDLEKQAAALEESLARQSKLMQQLAAKAKARAAQDAPVK